MLFQLFNRVVCIVLQIQTVDLPLASSFSDADCDSSKLYGVVLPPHWWVVTSASMLTVLNFIITAWQPFVHALVVHDVTAGQCVDAVAVRD